MNKKKEQIHQLFEQFENACYNPILSGKGIECWSARELQIIFNYTDWRNFLKVIDKAKKACEMPVVLFLTILPIPGK